MVAEVMPPVGTAKQKLPVAVPMREIVWVMLGALSVMFKVAVRDRDEFAQAGVKVT